MGRLTALQVEYAGTGKPKALGADKHHDGDGLYLKIRSATSKIVDRPPYHQRQGTISGLAR